MSSVAKIMYFIRMTNASLITVDSATIVRPTGETVIQDMTWTIHETETWAIVGPTGSGKTTLAETLVGRLRVSPGTIAWPLIDRLNEQGRQIDWPSQVIARVSFKEESRLFSYSHHYYQQRFNFIEPNDDLTLDQFLRSGVQVGKPEIDGVCKRLGLSDLRELSLIKLSNGQTRRARIAHALLAKPELMILDEPFMGLDAGGRAEVSEILGGLRAHGTRLIIITRPESIPEWVTHVLELNAGRIGWAGKRADYQPRTEQFTAASPVVSHVDVGQPIVEMRNVNVRYGDRPILHNLNWTIREGERWALLGPNGSGKTTLLSLIAADHPQAYSNDITLFGQKRGSGESIWDIKRNIGLISPEMHLYFSEPLSAFRAAATGFFDVLANRRINGDQEGTLLELFQHFGINHLRDRPFARLSTGEQRLVLIIRALVKSPSLLILDEPFQGLDSLHVRRLREWLDRRLLSVQSLVFVTHLQEEIPQSVTRRLQLDQGHARELI